MLTTDSLACGDCLSLLQSHEPESVHLVIADPPYNIGYSYDVYDDKRSDDDYLQWTADWIQACTRLLTPTGWFWIAIGDEYAAELKTIGERCGLHLRNWVIWYYTFGVHCRTKFTRSHTHLLYFTRDPKTFTFHADEIRVPSARQLVYGDKRANNTGRVPDNTWILRPQDVGDNGFLPDHSTWYFPRVAGTFKERAEFHGCQLPEQLLGRMIRSTSSPGETVLDPFTGTGSTLVVAKKLGRHWIGTELSPEYVQHARSRIEAVRVGDDLVGAEEPRTSAPRTAIGRSLYRKPRGLDDMLLREAFHDVAAGRSAERVIADPQLVAQFIDACSERRLTGRPADWCRAMLSPSSSATLFSSSAGDAADPEPLDWEAADAWEFGCEMTLRRLFDEGHRSVEDILCDPVTALRYDQLCRQVCPGYRSLQYRLVALKLRASLAAWQASEVDDCTALLSPEPTPITDTTAPPEPAVYLIRTDRDQPAFAGFTYNLEQRLSVTREALQGINDWVANTGKWVVQTVPVSTADHGRAVQRALVRREAPRLNWLEPASEDPHGAAVMAAGSRASSSR